MRIRIEATDLPGRFCGPSPDQPAGYQNVHVGVQRRNKPGEQLGLTAGDAASAAWTLACTVKGEDITGPYIQGPPGGRFIYLSWLAGDAADSRGAGLRMFRRAKLLLDAVPPDVLRAAIDRGELVGRLGLTDAKGHPTCAAVRPPQVEWSA